MADGSIGAYTTAELLGWFQGIVPTERAKKNVIGTDVPVMGLAREEFMVKEYGTAYNFEGDVRKGTTGTAVRLPDSDEEDFEDAFSYEPRYNLLPEDEAFVDDDEEEDFGPGRPINPSAKPGDHDYGVDENISAICEDFSFDEDRSPRLPVHDYQREILRTINDNKVS